MKICVVLPAYNEELTIAKTIIDYKNIFPDACVVVIDNNSNDQTGFIARQLLSENDKYLFEEVKGKAAAVKHGLSRVSSDFYILADADNTYPASEALKLLDIAKQFRYDMVVGDRLSNGIYISQNERFGHSFGNYILTYVISYVSNRKYKDALSGLRVFSRPLVDSLALNAPGFQIETELNTVSAYLNARIVEVSIRYDSRPDNSQSKLNTYQDGIKIFWYAIKFWIKTQPKDIFFLIAFLLAPLSTFLCWYILEGFMKTGEHYSTTSVFASACAVISFISLSVGVILHILNSITRSRCNAEFLEKKRHWNSRIDNEEL